MGACRALCALFIGGRAFAADPQPSVLPEGVPAPPPPVAHRLPLPATVTGLRQLSLGEGVVLVEAVAGLLRWDLNSGEIRPFGPEGSVFALAPGGNLAVLYHDQVSLLDPVTAAPVWQKPAGGAVQLAWTADGMALLGGGNKTLTVWAASDGARLEAPDTRSDRYAYAPRPQRLVMLNGKKVEIYDRTGAWTLLEGAGRTLLAMSPGGERLATAEQDLVLWDGTSRVALAHLPEPEVSALAFSPDGRLLAVGSRAAGGLRVYRADDGALAWRLPWPAPVEALTWSPDGLSLGALSGDRPVTWTLSEADLAVTLPGLGAVGALASRASDGLLAVGNAAGTLAFWGASGALTRAESVEGPITALAWSEGGESLAVRAARDWLIELDGARRVACLPELPPCRLLDAPAKATPPSALRELLPDAPLAAFGGGWAEGVGEAVRVWTKEGALQSMLWAGADGGWARWAEGRYTWGQVGPALSRRLPVAGEEALIRPPKVETTLSASADPVSLIAGGAAATVTVTVTNLGTNPAFDLALAPGPGPLRVAAPRALARLDAGARLSLPVTVAAPPDLAEQASLSLQVSSLWSAPVSVTVPAAVKPWPLSVVKVKRKGRDVTVTLKSEGGEALGEARVWLSCTDSAGVGTSLAGGAAGVMKPHPRGGGPADPVAFDTITFPEKGKWSLSYRLPDRAASDLAIVVAAPGAAARVTPLP